MITQGCASRRNMEYILVSHVCYTIFTRHSRAFALKSTRKLSTLHVFPRVAPPKRATTTTIDQQKHITALNNSQKHTNHTSTMSEATPRITAPYLEQFSHQTVRILGKVRQLRGEQATIDAGGQISVFLNRVSYVVGLSLVQILLL